MTTATVSPDTTTSRGPSVVDLAWVAWRQHRGLIILTALAVAVGTAWCLWAYSRAGSLPPCDVNGCLDGEDSARELYSLAQQATYLAYGVAAFSGVVAAFWGAPLLAREFEQRTHLWAWTQDVSPVRWLLTRILFLGAVITLLSVVLATTTSALARRVHSFSDWVIPPFATVGFELSIPVQLGYALFGFSLGLALSALTRRTVASMGITLIVFTAARVFIATVARPSYVAPVRQTTSLEGPYPGIALGADVMHLDAGYLDTAGNTVSYSSPAYDGCSRVASNSPSPDTYQAILNSCLTDHGVIHRYADYQPADRLLTFQLIETGIFLALAAALLAVTWLRIRKSTTI
ncbi:ABC transporter permease [Saccharopolyspora sp. 5N708]|uniref:ABC transporter permease n=1 Tax=Saccharopolyspora sp. 5N708 TaxID=3457424 RepID=UPI003FD4212E